MATTESRLIGYMQTSCPLERMASSIMTDLWYAWAIV